MSRQYSRMSVALRSSWLPTETLIAGATLLPRLLSLDTMHAPLWQMRQPSVMLFSKFSLVRMIFPVLRVPTKFVFAPPK